MTGEKQQPIIKVYDPVAEVTKAIASLRKRQKIISSAMVAIVAVVALGFIAMVIAVFAIFIDHQDYATERYNKYIELLEKQEQEIKKGTPGQANLDSKTVGGSKVQQERVIK